MSHPRKFTAAELRRRVGQEVLVSEWLQVDQHRITKFADATGDRQWIHVDEPRAARESPYGSTLAHGFLVLSLIPRLGEALFTAAGLRLSLNYGLNRVRFVSPVRANSRLRARYVLASEVEIHDTLQIIWSVTVDIEGESKPACVAEFITRWYGDNVTTKRADPRLDSLSPW
jgi:acyl dehydratase